MVNDRATYEDGFVGELLGYMNGGVSFKQDKNMYMRQPYRIVSESTALIGIFAVPVDKDVPA